MGHHSHHGHHHHHGHGHGPAPPANYAIQPFHGYGSPAQQQQLNHASADYRHHAHKEHVAEAVALGAGAFAMHESHKAKSDPEHASKHKLEAKVAGAVAMGSAAYAWHEHKEKKKDEKIIHKIEGHSNHGHHHHGKHGHHHH